MWEVATLKNLITFTCANCLSASQMSGRDGQQAFNVNVMKLQTDSDAHRLLSVSVSGVLSLILPCPVNVLLALLLVRVANLASFVTHYAASFLACCELRRVHRLFITTFTFTAKSSSVSLLLGGLETITGLNANWETCFAVTTFERF